MHDTPGHIEQSFLNALLNTFLNALLNTFLNALLKALLFCRNLKVHSPTFHGALLIEMSLWKTEFVDKDFMRFLDLHLRPEDQGQHL